MMHSKIVCICIERQRERERENPTRWSRRNSGELRQEGGLPAIPEDQPSSMTTAGEGTSDGQWGNNIQDNDVPAVSYYNADSRKFRRKEGHGPIQRARQQRIWEDWLSWRDNWRAENEGGRGRPQPESEEDKKRRDQEWQDHMAQVRGGGQTTNAAPQSREEWVQDVHGTWFQVSGPLPEC